MPLIQLIQEQTGAKLSYILDYQVVTILNKVLKNEFFVHVPILGLYQQSEEYSIWIPSSSAGSGSSRSSYVF